MKTGPNPDSPDLERDELRGLPPTVGQKRIRIAVVTSEPEPCPCTVHEWESVMAALLGLLMAIEEAHEVALVIGGPDLSPAHDPEECSGPGGDCAVCYAQKVLEDIHKRRFECPTNRRANTNAG